MPPRNSRKADSSPQEPEVTNLSNPLDLGDDRVNEDINSADGVYIPEEPDYLPAEPSRLSGGYEPPPDESSKAKSSPPRIDEWQDFFSRILIKTATDFYINAAFEGIDEDLLTDADVERIRMAPEERDRIAKPFSEMVNKIKFFRKHGRLIIAGGGIGDSVIALGMWVRRVNRIARKYRNRTLRGQAEHVSSGPYQPQASGNGNGQFQPNAGQYYSTGG